MEHQQRCKIDVRIDYRAAIDFSLEERRVEQIFNKFLPYYYEFRFDGFKFYWNHWKGDAYLYLNSKHKMWANEMKSEEKYALIKNGLDQVMIF